MPLLKRMPNSRRYPYGMEWRILKSIPLYLVSSALVIGLFTVVAHLLPPQGTPVEVHKYLEFVNIIAIASLITVWTALLTLAFGAFIVYLMKGPAFVWDPLELVDSDEPKV